MDEKPTRNDLCFSHVGFHVSDLRGMEHFYRTALKFTVTDRGRLGVAELVFLSRDPAEHHQIVLVSGRPESLPFNVINQVSFRVPDLDALRAHAARLSAAGARELEAVTHGNAISIYFRDPEGIGTAGRRIPESQAWNHIAGYGCYNDGSIRDWQTATSQWTPGKNFWRTGGFGPWMVTADEIAPGRRMTLVTRLNGQEMQRTTTDLLIHSIPRLIAHASTFLPLAPGDVLVTGTPGGVGLKRNPPVFMKPGDVVEVDVDAIGCLRNTIADE